MVQAITKFTVKNTQCKTELEKIFKKLKCETAKEDGFINYEVFTTEESNLVYYVIEQWTTRNALDNHADKVASNGYLELTKDLLAESINTEILILIK